MVGRHRRRGRAVRLAVAAVLVASAASAAALPEARISVAGDVVRLAGPISRETPKALDAALARAPQVRTVLLDSPGGEILGGLSTAAVIRRNGLNTMVPANADCASACVLLLAAGVERVVAPRTRVGVHQWRYPRPVSDDVRAQDTSLLRGVFASLGVAVGIVDLMIGTPHDRIRWLSRSEMRELGLITADIEGR